jgi:hypothetical protein
MMIAGFLPCLFAAAALLALGAIVHGWLRYGSAALAVRGQLAACPEFRDVRFVIRELPRPVTRAVIIRPDFTRRANPRTPYPAMRAAA